MELGCVVVSPAVDDVFYKLRVAGFHGEREAFSQLRDEHGIDPARAEAEWNVGERMKLERVSCTCTLCRLAAF